ncbi:MAG: universal stress protein [SAR202 cluster bacterium]|nr:universal stress protein [SAR202 cluster bacterium]
MSTHGRNFIARGILGSVTDKVIHASRVPVLTITPKRAADFNDAVSGFKRITLLLDGSTVAEQALPYVERIAAALSLTVSLLRVVNL